MRDGLINELSVFVDESGSFDSSIEPSRFYIVTLVLHDQLDDIHGEVAELESQLGYLGYPDTCVHTGPLFRREENFRELDIEQRRKILGRMLAFTRKLPIKFTSLVVDKKRFETPNAIADELLRQLEDVLRVDSTPLNRAKSIKIYYDNGQDQVKTILKEGLKHLPTMFKPDVSPEKYRLFQAADLICSIELLRVKHDAGIELNKSEEYFFGKWRDLKKKYIAPISRLAV